MVRVSMAFSIANALAHTVHIGMPTPVKVWQLALMIKIIFLLQVRHAVPVKTPNVFAPAQDLTNKAFYRIERCDAVEVGLFRRFHYLHGQQ